MAKLLTHVRVEGLFGYLDHTFEFPAEDEFVCLHGPNGVGKTKLLELVAAALTGASNKLATTPFARLHLEFQGGDALTIERGGDATHRDLVWLLTENGVNTRVPIRSDPKERQRAIRFLQEEGVIRRGSISDPARRWRDTDTGQPLTEDEITSRFASLLPSDIELNPPAIADFILDTPVDLIEVNRLRGVPVWSGPRMGPTGEPQQLEASDHLARMLADQITAARARNSVVAQESDRTYPARLIRGFDVATLPSESELRQQFDELTAERKLLQSVKLLEEENPVEFPLGELDQWRSFALQLHIEDSRRKLASFRELQKRISLFKEIIDTKLSHKRLVLDADRGFFFAADRDVELAPSDLSSGEQHQVVLAYRLIFDSKEGQLVLVDEPELSLHVSWQRQFLDDLLRIAQLRNLRFVVATHSPQIIAHWGDRMASLGDME